MGSLLKYLGGQKNQPLFCVNTVLAYNIR